MDVNDINLAERQQRFDILIRQLDLLPELVSKGVLDHKYARSYGERLVTALLIFSDLNPIE